MRQIIVRYQGECRKCNSTLPVGSTAVHERKVGIFCPECAPTNPEEIREYRSERAEKKAERLASRAKKLHTEAQNKQATFNRMRGDIAFITQPGRFPACDRIMKSYNRGLELQNEAEHLQGRADSLRRTPQVAGDAERKRQKRREAVRKLLSIGMEVNTGIYGRGVIQKINKKTAKISNTGVSGTYTVNVDLSFITPIKET